MNRKIYIASSWKMADVVLDLAHLLRKHGKHEVYAFCETGQGHFVFDARDWHGKDLSLITAHEAVTLEPFKHAFECDKAGLDWADTCVLMLPAGKSSHLEAGYAVGCGKDLFIYGDKIPGEFDVMYGFARGIFDELHTMLAALDGERIPAPSQEEKHG